MTGMNPEGSGQRFCTGCGAPLRGEAAFCVGCGRPRAGGSSVADHDADPTQTAAGSPAPPTPAHIDRFEIRAILGEGRCGPVFRAFDPDLGRLVAVRQLAPAVVADQQWYDRLRRAVSRMAGITNAHCVEIYSLDAEATPPVLLNEYVDGPSLRALIEAHGPLTPQACLVTLDGALAGLDHIHTLGISHGYVTPSCVLLDRDGVSKLTDVGLGYGGKVPANAQAYLAPEVRSGTAPGSAADLFGAAALFAFALTAATPGVESLGRLPADLRAVIAGGLSTQPTSRPATVTDFRDAVAQAAESAYGSDWREAGTASIGAIAATGWLGLVVVDAVPAATALFSAAKVAAFTTVIRPVEAASVGMSSAHASGTGATATHAAAAHAASGYTAGGYASTGYAGAGYAGGATAAGIGVGAKIAIAAVAASAVLVGGGAVAYRVHADNVANNVANQVPTHPYAAPAGPGYEPQPYPSTPTPYYSTPAPAPQPVANDATGSWVGDWNRTATGERFAFRLNLNQSADGTVTGVLVGSGTGPAGPMSYNVSGSWSGDVLTLDGVSWNNKTKGAFLDHMVFTAQGSSQLTGSYAPTSNPTAFRGSVSAVRT